MPRTYVPVPRTSKAFWATLTGFTPDVQPQTVEAALADRPYESLATLLRRSGYRSVFFEMSQGSFQGEAGIFRNLGFDSAYFREDLADSSSYLGYLGGDDFQMIDPMFRWIDRQRGPWLVTTITSASHDPYVLPKWYGEVPSGDRRERYLAAVRFGDAFLGQILAELRRRGLERNTLVCALGDHGEAIGPETSGGRWVPAEDVVRVPWVLYWPDHVHPGRVIETACSQMDVTPTLLTLMGYDVRAAGFDGRDALQAPAGDERHYFTMWYAHSPQGFVEGWRKVIYWPQTGTAVEYDLRSDPAEQSPRSLRGPARDAALAALKHWQSVNRIDFPPERRREEVIFDNWRTLSLGRRAWASYVPDQRQASLWP